MEEKQTNQLPVSPRAVVRQSADSGDARQEVQTQPPSFLDKLKIHKFKILGGFFGVLVFAGAVFGAYKLGQRVTSPKPTSTPQPEAGRPLDETANWITYMDIEYGYSIKYPNDWIQTVGGEGVNFSTPVIAKKGFPKDFVKVTVSFEQTYENLSLEEYLEMLLGGLGIPVGVPAGTKILEKQRIKIDDKNALMITLDPRGTCPEGCDSMVRLAIISINNNKFIRLVLYPNFQENYEKAVPIFNLMLSTFKFLEEEQEWETYRNTVFGFEFKYPAEFVIEDKLSTERTKFAGAKDNLVLTDLKENTRMSLWINPEGFGPFFPNKVFEVSYSQDKGIYVTKEEERDVSQYRDPNDKNIEIMIPQTTRLKDLGFFAYFIYDKTSGNKEDLFKKILSTFRFLE